MKLLSYLVVGVAAFVVGGATFYALGQSASGDKPTEPAATTQNISTAPQREFVIEGMHCQGCADSLTSAIGKVPGVRAVSVSFDTKRAVVDADPSATPDEKIIAAVVETGYQAKPAGAASELPRVGNSEKSPILVNITRGTDELHAVSMAIGLAQSALNDGRQATIFLNVSAPVFAAKDLGDEVKFADFPPVKKMLADFIDHGGKVLVCEHCAKVVKLPKENLIDRATLAGHGRILTELTPGTVVFSY